MSGGGRPFLKAQLGPVRRSAIAALTLLCVMAPAQAQAPELAVLDGLTPGEWELRYRDGAPAQKLCVRNGRDLIQLRHRSRACSRYVTNGGANHVSVHYTCASYGYGQTDIRTESATLAQVSSQGIASGSRFEFTAEARRVGNCR